MEEDMLFNPIMKKKKKKKDISLELQGDDLKIESDNKPKNAFNMEEISEALPETLNNAEDAEGTDIFDLSLKKKKKKKNVVTFDDQDNLHMNGLDEDTHEASTFANEDDVTSSWSNTDRDYTYDELLLRVFEIMRDKNPDLVAGEKKRLVMKPPQVVRVGTKKTSFVNFHDICKLLHRQPKHLLAFLLSELGTSGSVDGNNQLIIKGKFQQKQIENILRRYIKEYVTCHTCHSPETLLQKETRLFFLQCERCGSRCSVAAIKSGFQAVTGKRAAIRANTAMAQTAPA
ncbi:eukaryotic translation initiation factor 2 subunit 2-like [Gordionus sp. m RMFG-2023]|uniref:eukaryotic translation initiation factor 2 subunit 2-like n=1 Tax=Gordionus sp. m RMFG-2023 TaxID=3053472 RepID=UPI0031FDD44C